MSNYRLEDKNILYKIDELYVLRNFMPFPLKESNCYLAESNEGWTVIDTGVNIPLNRDIWTKALKEIGISFKNIKNIYLTHYHHDHIGLAGWIQHHSDCNVFLSAIDCNTFNTYINGNSYFEHVKDICLNAGWTLDLIQKLAQDISEINAFIDPYPYLSIIPDNKPVFLGKYKLYPMSIPGHSDGHVVFYSNEAHILFSGDNIVDHAILHLTDWPHTTLDNQIKAHLDGLENLLTLTINTVLPGHGPSFMFIRDKIELIKDHHNKRRQKVLDNLTSPMSAWELTCKIFKDNDYIHIKRLLLAETLAYLNSLKEMGLVEVDTSHTPYIYKKNQP